MSDNLPKGMTEDEKEALAEIKKVGNADLRDDDEKGDK